MLADPAVYKARLRICESCDRSQQIEVPGLSLVVLRCKECGCLMKAKAKIASAACPLGKFEPV
jgi:uncharacterized Zn finger protein